MKASIIIPTFERPNSLKRTLEKIALCQNRPDEVIVVDQSQNHDKNLVVIQQIKEQYAEMNIVCVKQEQPSSSIARNIGMKRAKNDILIFMDDDVDVMGDTFGVVEAIFEQSQIAMLGGLDCNAPKSGKLSFLMGVRSYRLRNIGHVTKAMFGRYPNEVKGQVKTQWAMGYFFVIRKSLAERWQIEWNQKFYGFSYAEDLDFTYDYAKHAENEGYVCILDERLVVEHRCSREWRVASKKSTYMFVFHREYLSYKFFPSDLWSRVMTRYANLGFIMQRIIRHDNAGDLIRAQLDCEKYRRDIKEGKMHYELFE